MLLLVGGQTRKAGKTLVAEGIVQSLAHLEWTAVKITPHSHGAAHPPAAGMELAEIPPAAVDGDTGRYLAAGARRAFLLTVAPTGYPVAARWLRQRWEDGVNLIVESNRILRYLRPDFVVAVLAPDSLPKESAELLLELADVTVTLPAPGASSDPCSSAEILCRGQRIHWNTLCATIAGRAAAPGAT